MLLKPKIIVTPSKHFTRVLEDPITGICFRCRYCEDCTKIKIGKRKLSYYCFNGVINKIRSNLYSSGGLWNYLVE